MYQQKYSEMSKQILLLVWSQSWTNLVLQCYIRNTSARFLTSSLIEERQICRGDRNGSSVIMQEWLEEFRMLVMPVGGSYLGDSDRECYTDLIPLQHELDRYLPLPPFCLMWVLLFQQTEDLRRIVLLYGIYIYFCSNETRIFVEIGVSERFRIIYLTHLHGCYATYT